MAKKLEQETTSFGIDQDHLDKEWVEQPERFHRYAVQLADARRTMEEAKQKLDVVKAELDSKIRERPAHYDVEKLTETTVAMAILVQPEHAKALADLNAARHHVDIVQAAVTAMDHRKKALENLVFLHGQDYFSSPRARGADAEKMKEVEKKRVRGRTVMSHEDLREDGE